MYYEGVGEDDARVDEGGGKGIGRPHRVESRGYRRIYTEEKN